MDCILFRHGIAVNREDWEGPDADRHLTPKGITRTEQAAVGLRRLDMRPDVLLSSPFTRALETAKLVKDALRYRRDIQICDELLPDSPPDKIFALLGSLPPDACVICVGHEPHLSDTAGVMIFGKPANGLYLKKAGVAMIQFDGTARAGQGALAWWVIPSQLRSLK